MSEFFDLATKLADEFPSARIDVREGGKEEGFHFINIYLYESELAVEYKPYQGYGVSGFASDSDDIDGLFSQPDLFFEDVNDVYRHVITYFEKQKRLYAR